MVNDAPGAQRRWRNDQSVNGECDNVAHREMPKFLGERKNADAILRWTCRVFVSIRDVLNVRRPDH